MSFNYIPPPGTPAPAVKFNKITYGVAPKTVHMLDQLERVPPAKTNVFAFPAPQVSFVKNVKRKNNAVYDLEDLKEAYIMRHNLPPRLNLRRREKPCIFKNINVEHRSIRSKCLGVPKLSQRGWTYTTNADESAGRIPPRMEYLHSHSASHRMNPWNYKRDSQANQLRKCPATDNAYYDFCCDHRYVSRQTVLGVPITGAKRTNIDSLKFLVPEDTKYILCESVKNPQLSDKFFRRMASDRLHLSRYALYERYLQTELNDTRDFHKPDIKFLHGIYNFKHRRNLYDNDAQLGNISNPYVAAKKPFTVGELHASLHPVASSAHPIEEVISNSIISMESPDSPVLSPISSSVHVSVSVVDALGITSDVNEKIIVDVVADEFLKHFIETDQERILLADIHAFRRHHGLMRSDDTGSYHGVTIDFMAKYPKEDQADEPPSVEASDKSSWATSLTVSADRSDNLARSSHHSITSLVMLEKTDSETSSLGINSEDFDPDEEGTEATSFTLEECQNISREDISTMHVNTSLHDGMDREVRQEGRDTSRENISADAEENEEVIISSHLNIETETGAEELSATADGIEGNDPAIHESNIVEAVTEESNVNEDVANGTAEIEAVETIDVVEPLTGTTGVVEVEAKESGRKSQVDISIVKNAEPEETKIKLVPREESQLSNVIEEAVEPGVGQIHSQSTEVVMEQNVVEEIPPDTIEPHEESAE